MAHFEGPETFEDMRKTLIDVEKQRDEMLEILEDIIQNHYIEMNTAVRIKNTISKIKGDE